MRLLNSLVLLTVVIFLFSCSTPEPKKVEIKSQPSKIQTKNIKAWENMQYGMFLSYNINTYTGNEYDEGGAPASVFNPTNLDVRQWVKTAKNAGMKYAILTAKHMSGFCLWDSKVQWKGKEYDYDIGATDLKVDIVAEYMKACKEEGIAPGIYYCVLDPYNEGKVDWKSQVTDEYFELVKAHVTELNTLYKGIKEFWLDIPAKLNESQRFEMYRIINELNPGCLITCNNSFNDGVDVLNWPVDLVNGERTLPPTSGHNPNKEIDSLTYYIPMEVCQTISQFWFWMPDDAPKATCTLYHWYNQCQKRGASLLLNVPPDRSGRIPEELVDRLMDLKTAIDNPSTLEPSESLTYYKPIKGSSTWMKRPEYRFEYAIDNDTTTRWIASRKDTLNWLEVDLGEEKEFNTVYLEERLGGCIEEAEVQVKNGKNWNTVSEISNFSKQITQSFEKVKAQFVRLKITKYNQLENKKNIMDMPSKPTRIEGASVSEFHLYLREG